ncbi:hypothetical protein bcCo53_001125 (plasmid) [Borrelia coriaceae]|uniref:Putative membrane spanning protein n=1 Tax=Borrelia coriaceae ATCC 43381 TaxID=1408429 RepID=W5T1M8_9SPIR|nr:CRASP family complement regulator-acquiring lipoprotein [Borrelia coriaceae]AHH11171.1 Putative membrane spanning protein [Borrelia coriaceae ATCC 43381]UPA16957.1 hypothetical protein bcCo53_001125 [Borrelia coriaceae]
MKHKIFIFFILTSLILLACSQGTTKTDGDQAKLTQEEASKQCIINHVSEQLSPITKIMEIHNDATKAEMPSLLEANGLFGVTKYKNKAGADTLYNANDDESKKNRKEVYLALEYSERLINDFAVLANRMAAVNDNSINTALTTIVNKMSEYARAYYKSTVLERIRKLNEEDANKLSELSLDDLKKLKTNLDTIETSHRNLQHAVMAIKQDYDDDIEVGTVPAGGAGGAGGAAARHRLKTNATATETADYFVGKKDQFENDLNNLIKAVNEVNKLLK